MLHAHRAWQMPGRAAVRAGAKVAVGEGENTALLRNDEIAAEHQAESGTGDRTFDGTDNRHWQGLHVIDDDMDTAQDRIEPGAGRVFVVAEFLKLALEALDVTSGHEVIPGTCEDDAADVFCISEGAGDVDQRRYDIVVDGIQAIGPVDGDGGDGTLDIEPYSIIR